MNYQDLIKSGSLRKEKVGFEQINKILERAHKNIKSARVLFDNNDTISSTETENAIRSAFNFIDRIEEFIQKKNPQKKLFNRRK